MHKYTLISKWAGLKKKWNSDADEPCLYYSTWIYYKKEKNLTPVLCV